MANSNGPELDDHQYTVAGLKAYEAIYGTDFVSPGGRSTTREMLTSLRPRPGDKVLDVGSGLGGAAFMMANEFGLLVTAIDMSHNMATEARRRCEAYGLSDRVECVQGDVVQLPGTEIYDLVWSREVFLHIHDKAALFSTLFRVLKPGGRLFFTDYCCGDGPLDSGFEDYISEFGYCLKTLGQTEQDIRNAGFEDVAATDATADFISIHQREIEGLAQSDLSEEEKSTLTEGWLDKIERAEAGQQGWGHFRARKA